VSWLQLVYSLNNRLISQICWSQLNGTARQRSLRLRRRLIIPAGDRNIVQHHSCVKLTVVCFCIQTLRPFLASCQGYLALLGSPQSRSMIHVGMFISLSSELAVAASPLRYRLAKGQLHQRMTIKELQVRRILILSSVSGASVGLTLNFGLVCVYTYTNCVWMPSDMLFCPWMIHQRQAPAIDWLGCLQAVFHPLSLSEDDRVLLHNLPYIVQMSRIINKWLNKHELSRRYCKVLEAWRSTIHKPFCVSFFDPFLSFCSP